MAAESEGNKDYMQKKNRESKTQDNRLDGKMTTLFSSVDKFQLFVSDNCAREIDLAHR